MCIVCFFLGYFVADVISKCGFGKEHFQKLIYEEHLGRKTRRSQPRLGDLRSGDLRSGNLESDLGGHNMPGGSSQGFPSNMR